MSDFELFINTANVGQLLKSEATLGVLMQQGINMANRAGEGWAVKSGKTKDSSRVAVFVVPESDEAKQDNLDNNTGLKSIGG